MFPNYVDDTTKDFQLNFLEGLTHRRPSLGECVERFFADRGAGDERMSSAFRAGIVVKSRSVKSTTKHHRR